MGMLLQIEVDDVEVKFSLGAHALVPAADRTGDVR